MAKTYKLESCGNEYWPSVTDVPCPGCTVGIVRWAEAGHVPGWRKCDTCGRHFLAGGTAAAPTLELRRRATKRVIDHAAVERQRIAQHERLRAIDAEDGRRHAEGSIKGDGVDISAYWGGSSEHGSPGYGTGEAQRAYWERLTELAPDRVAIIRRLQASLPPSVSLCNLHSDGECMLYRTYYGSQLGGGTYLAAADAILTATPRNGILADDYARLVGAQRGYRVPTNGVSPLEMERI